MDFASANQYNGIELRGIQRQMDLDQCVEFSTPERIKETLMRVSDKNLKITDLGSSATLHFEPGAERKRNLDEGRRFIDLVEQLACPYVRVFPNNILPGRDQAYTIDLIVKGLSELAGHARGAQVTVLMETHGDMVKVKDIKNIITLVSNDMVGLVWDIVNMWSVTKERPAYAFEELKSYIRHVHIKDALIKNESLHYTLLGQGQTPVFEGIDTLLKSNYKGYYSFEWEKLWHPEIAAPELAPVRFSKHL